MNYKEEVIKHKIRQAIKTKLYADFGALSTRLTKLSLKLLRLSVNTSVHCLKLNRYIAVKMVEVTNDNTWYEDIKRIDKAIESLKLMSSS